MSKDVKKLIAEKGKGQPLSRKKIIIRTSVAVVVCGAMVASAIIFFPKKAPDPTKMAHQDAIKYVASKNFAALPAPEKQKFFEKMGENGNPREFFRNINLNEKERQQFRDNMRVMFQMRMEAQAKKLLAMTKEERAKEYDRIADEIRKRMAARGQQGGPGGGPRPNPGTGDGNGGGNGPGPGRGGGNNVARMQQRYEGTSSDTRAIMAEMRKEIGKRLQR